MIMKYNNIIFSITASIKSSKQYIWPFHIVSESYVLIHTKHVVGRLKIIKTINA